MNQDAFSSQLHQEHLDWLNSKLSSKQKKLALMEDVVTKAPDFDEAEKLIIELQTDITYCGIVLEILKKNFNEESDRNEIRPIDDIDDDLTEEQDHQPLQSEVNRREPMDMLRPQYIGMLMADIIDSILSDSPQILSSDELTNIAYETENDDEFERAKASISAQLRIGAKQGKWVKVGRGSFASHSVIPDQEIDSPDDREIF